MNLISYIWRCFLRLRPVSLVKLRDIKVWNIVPYITSAININIMWEYLSAWTSTDWLSTHIKATQKNNRWSMIKRDHFIEKIFHSRSFSTVPFVEWRLKCRCISAIHDHQISTIHIWKICQITCYQAQLKLFAKDVTIIWITCQFQTGYTPRLICLYVFQTNIRFGCLIIVCIYTHT